MAVSETMTCRLAFPADAAALASLRAEAEAAVAQGARRLILDLAQLEILDSPVISTLISILRAARERDVEIHVVTSRQRVVDTFGVTGLDKLFILGAPAEAPPAPAPALSRAKRSRIRRIATTLGLFGLLLAAPAASSAAAGTETLPPDEIVSRLAAQNPQMQSYQARVHVDFRLRSFPYLTQHLEGTTYYKRPDNYEVVFSEVPSYARGFDKLYTDVGDPSGWEKRYVISLVGEKEVGHHQDLVLRLVQRVRGMIDHEDVLVDTRAWHVDNIEWDYYNGGVITMSQEYESIAGFSVLRAQHATIKIPFVHASAEGRYDDYHPNVAIDDAVFTKVKH